MKPRKTKILHILSGGGIGGAERSTQWLASLIDRNQFELSFIFLYTGGPIAETIKDMGYSVKILEWSSGFSIRGRIKLMRLIRQISPDVIHVHDSTPLAITSMRLVTRKKIIKTQHEMIIGSRLKYWGLRLDDKCIDLLIPNSEYTMNTYANLFGRAPIKMKLVYLGLHLPSYSEGIWKTELFRPFNKKEINIAFLGRLELIKGIMDLPHLAKNLQNNKKFKFNILVAGDGPYKEDCIQLCTELDVHNIDFVGWKDNVINFLSVMDILVFPSHWQETFGLVLLEAIACGLPVVAYDVGAVREILQFAPGAHLISVNNIDGMSSAIINIVSKNLWPAYDDCKNYISQNFSMEKTVKELQNIYIDLKL